MQVVEGGTLDVSPVLLKSGLVIGHPSPTGVIQMNERVIAALEKFAKFAKTQESQRTAGLEHRQATQELVSALADAGVSIDDHRRFEC
jgi:fructose-1,6-bisphosphatase/sedoheptulose 1,7-bisphosphatase-like protein